MTTSTPFRDLLHAANLRHGTDGFTSPPKEGVPLKIRRLRPGLNPRTWVLKASTLPLDHRRRRLKIYESKMARWMCGHTERNEREGWKNYKLCCLRAVAGKMKLKGRGCRWDAGKWCMPLDFLSCKVGCVKSNLKDGDMTKWEVVCWTGSE